MIDSLCWTNIDYFHPHATPWYARQIFRLLVPDGLFILQTRPSDMTSIFGIESARGRLPASFRRYFTMSDLVMTHLPEYRLDRADRDFAKIQVSIGRRRRRVG